MGPRSTFLNQAQGMAKAQQGALEEKYDEQFTVVFEAIRDLMIPRSSAKRRIGFAAR
jgi:hypothetical protein